MLTRPESAWPGGSKSRSGNIKRFVKDITVSKFIQKQSEIHPDGKDNIQESSQYLHQTKSEYCKNGRGKMMTRNQLARMLIKIELQKMGFMQEMEVMGQSIINRFLEKEHLEEIQLKNLRRWVLGKKSQLVEMVLKGRVRDEERGWKMVRLEEKIEENIQQIVHNNQQQIENNVQDYSINPFTIAQHENYLKNESSSIGQSLDEESIDAIPQLELKLETNHQDSKIILCPICLEQTTKFIKRKCGHFFCFSCFENYILCTYLPIPESINNGTYLIDCPQQSCSTKISQIQAQKILTRKDLQRFIKFKEKIELQSNPYNKFCNQPDCGRLLVENENKKLYCQECKIEFCGICQEVIHDGELCNQAIKKTLAQTYTLLNIKKCPNCSSPIQKIDGCNHMTCKKCKNQFCWICLKPYTPYHYRIYNCCGCPGLQFEDIDDLAYKRFLQVIFFIFLPLLLLLTIGTVLGLFPLYLLFNLFVRPCKWLSDYHEKCELVLLTNLCKCLPESCINLMGYFLLLPRSIIYALVIGPYMYFILVINYLLNVI